MKLIAIAMIAAALLGGCADFVAGYNEARAHRGEPGYSQADYLSRIGNDLESGAGRFAEGYSAAAEAQPPHGVMTGYVGGQSVWINY
jgi:hypothetical protein